MPVNIFRGQLKYVEGLSLIIVQVYRVLYSATVEENVPPLSKLHK